MATDIPISCACGQFQAVVKDANSRTGNHGICYCIDCQAFARHLGQMERVCDAKGGTELYQTQPRQVKILAGQDKLAALQLAPKGLYRWYASCCNSPIGNTIGNPRLSFVGLVVANMHPPEGALGPIAFRYKSSQALSEVSEPQGSTLAFAAKTIRNMLGARLS